MGEAKEGGREMDKFKLAFSLERTTRRDGSSYIRSLDIPGFHYVFEPGEGIDAALPALSEFLTHYLRAAAKINLTVSQIEKGLTIDEIVAERRGEKKPAPRISMIAEMAG